ncbi:MAG: choice-of-anchor V domain-containing protein [Elusimicrobiota bacterium]
MPLLIALCLGFGLRRVVAKTANPPDGYTGAPGDGQCTDCHSAGSSSNGSADIALTLPSAYKPGADYTITFTIISDNNNGSNGFEVTTIRDGNLSHSGAGAWKNAGSNSTISANWWKHSAQSAAASFTVTWTARSAGNALIRFSAAANRGGGAPNGDIHFTNAAVAELPSITSLTPSFGAVGSTTTITGVAFGVVPGTVTLNAMTAFYSSWSDTSITAVIPSTATGKIVVKNSIGSSDGLVFTISSASNQSSSTSSFSGAVLSSESIKWSWSSQADISAYALTTSTAGFLAALSGSTTFWIETGLAAGANYSRLLRAENNLGFAESSTQTVITPDASLSIGANEDAALSAENGATQVQVPAGALGGAGSVLVSLDPVTKPITALPADIASANSALDSSQILLAGSLREFAALAGGELKTDNFASPITISLSYADASNDGVVDNTSPSLRAQQLQLYTLNAASKRWEAVPGFSLNTSGKKISAPVSHFSVYALLGVPSASSLNSLTVLPNPYRPGSGGNFDGQGIFFRYLTERATIRIFSVSGELLVTLEKHPGAGDQLLWDGKNSSGHDVASGTYLYSAQDDGGRVKTGQLAIIR